MSYTNGIGATPQSSSITEAAASSSANRTAKTESSSSPVLQNQDGNPTRLDEASVSSAANMVAQALSGSDVRTDKVAALQQSIAAGTYNVPASDVAAKVLSALLN